LKNKFNVKVIDVYKLKGLEKTNLIKILKSSSHIITLEEQTLNGGFGSTFCEIICDQCLNAKIKRFGLNERFIFENGTRDQLLNKNGLEINFLISQSEVFLKND
jgi:transketolase C-terminal domain/subunit